MCALLLLADFCYGIVPLFDLIFTFISTVTIWSVVKAIAMLSHRKIYAGMDTNNSSNNNNNNATPTPLLLGSTKRMNVKIYKPNANWLATQVIYEHSVLFYLFFFISPLHDSEKLSVSFLKYYFYLLWWVLSRWWNMYRVN